MKTEDLIAMLARGPLAVDRHTTERCLGVAAAVSAAAAALWVLGASGPNPAIDSELARPTFWFGPAFSGSLAIAAFAASCRLARPGVLLGKTRFMLAAPFVVAAVVAGFALYLASPGERTTLFAQDAPWCAVQIALLSLPGLVAAFGALRSLAPTRPRAAGACAGLLAGAIAATIYAFHCGNVQAPFVAVWYSLGMSIPAGAGGMLGPRFLRWT